MSHPAIGLPVESLDTPALCLDLDALDRNIARIAARCRAQGVAWRPHAKGHKSIAIARRQLAAGAIGLTCAKLGEAEVFAAAGVRDLLIANQVVGAEKLARLAALARVADPIVAVDSVEQLDPLAAAAREAGVVLRVVVEVDLGLERAGVLPEAAPALARAVAARRGVELAGIFGYEGHLLTIDNPAEKETRIRLAMARLVGVRDALVAEGLPCPIVSAGGTGSYAITLDCPGVTELQAGGLILMDGFYRHCCQVAEFEHALTLLTTVVSRPTIDRAIVDAGRKCHHADLHPTVVVGLEREAVFDQLSAEHGRLRLAPEAQRLRIGDRLRLIPGYSDFTCVLHNHYFVTQADRVVDVWPLDTRGLVT